MNDESVTDQDVNFMDLDFSKIYNDDTMSNSVLNVKCKYHLPDQFLDEIDPMRGHSYFNLNCRGLSAHWDQFYELVSNITNNHFSFDFIGLTEVFKTNHDQRLHLPFYHKLITKTRQNNSRGGVGLFVKDNIEFSIREDLSVFIPHVVETLFIEFTSKSTSKCILGVIYRPNSAPHADIDTFSQAIFDIIGQINSENKKCVIMGDMNLDLLKFSSHNKTNTFIDNMFAAGYIPLITKPTRVTASTATLIDHMYTNSITPSSSGIILTDIADHFGTFYYSHNNERTRNVATKTARNFNEQNIQNFLGNLSEADFGDVLGYDCTNQAYDSFIEKYLSLFDESFPKLTRRISVKNQSQPWMTHGLRISTKRKHKLYSKMKQKPTQQNIHNYKTYNASLNKLKRSQKAKYFCEEIEKHKSNVKETWSVLNKAMGLTRKKENFPSYVTIGNKNVTDKAEIADEFNHFFINICEDLTKNLPQTSKSFKSYINPVQNSLFLDEITLSEIISIVDNLKPKTSSGYDEVSSRLLKLSLPYIIHPLLHIFQTSFSTGCFPDKMKIARVIPIHKRDDPHSLKNYRPISLLSSFSKILEKLMFNRITSFLNKFGLLYKHQYGFRQNHSTTHPILHLLNNFAETFNEKESSVISIFCDLTKAFDIINHDILLQKLHMMGIRGTCHKWLCNYLLGRFQYTDIDGYKSEITAIQSGVPQGSILGPLLFLVYINDIHLATKESILLFADDLTLTVVAPELSALYCKSNTAIHDLYTWIIANKLILNTAKTKYIIIRKQTKSLLPSNYELKIYNTKIDRIESFNFLGLHIDEHLSWKNHINN